MTKYCAYYIAYFNFTTINFINKSNVRVNRKFKEFKENEKIKISCINREIQTVLLTQASQMLGL